ncbi:MAG: hypothetical protein WA982_00450 [Rubrobacteraceae bacterium]
MNAEDQARLVGERAEEVASWYFRLNGFLSIPGYVVHPDTPRRFPRTEADLMAVRFPHSVEKINQMPMQDDRRLTDLTKPTQTLFVLVEVKSDLCKINGPWSRESEGNMQRAIGRLGFAGGTELDEIAGEMYRSLRRESNDNILQYIAVGKRRNDGLANKYSALVQITWKDIGKFLYYRFKKFPEKLGIDKPVHLQWPFFGRTYGEYSQVATTRARSEKAIETYIRTGSLQLAQSYSSG